MGELTGSSVPVAFPIQQYSEITVEVNPARITLKRSEVRDKLVTAIKEGPSPIPRKSYFVELRFVKMLPPVYERPQKVLN